MRQSKGEDDQPGASTHIVFTMESGRVIVNGAVYKGLRAQKVSASDACLQTCPAQAQKRHAWAICQSHEHRLMSALCCAAEESKDGMHEPHSGRGWKRREARSYPADSHVQHWQCRRGWQVLHNCGERQSKVALFVIRGLRGSLIATDDIIDVNSQRQPTY